MFFLGQSNDSSQKKNIGFALLVSQPLRLFAKLLHCSLNTAISLLFFIIATLQIYFHLREAFSLSVNVRQNAAVFVTKIHRHYKFYIPPPSLVPVPLCIWVLNYRSRAEKFIINTSPLAPQVHTSQLNLGFSKRRLRQCQWFSLRKALWRLGTYFAWIIQFSFCRPFLDMLNNHKDS